MLMPNGFAENKSFIDAHIMFSGGKSQLNLSDFFFYIQKYVCGNEFKLLAESGSPSPCSSSHTDVSIMDFKFKECQESVSVLFRNMKSGVNIDKNTCAQTNREAE